MNNLNKDDILQAIEFSNSIAKRPDAEGKQLYAIVSEYLSSMPTSYNDKTTEAFDKSVFDGSGYAFLWSDVIALEKFGTDILSNIASPDLAVKLLKGIMETWMRMRDVRVHLNSSEFRVMRVIASGACSPKAVQDQTDYSADRVNELLNRLKNKKYKTRNGEISLIEETANGNLKTRF